MKACSVSITMILAGLLFSRDALCQSGSARGIDRDSVRQAIGEHYQAGWLHSALLGSAYRDVWAVPVAIPVLDLGTFDGGLRPVSRGGGLQTTSLRLRARDGREYLFRSIDKDPTRNLPPELVESIAADIAQDQTSSNHPTGPLIVARLLEAAGVLHPTPRLFMLPDEARLGEFQGDFARMIGMLERRIALVPGDNAPWSGAAELIDGNELFDRVNRSSDDRVDVRAFLKARLVDLLVGDWDRHRDQWSWVRFGEEKPHFWLPIPKDRDFALVRYDGLFPTLARQGLPYLIDFGPDYPGILGLTWNGREVDRRFLLEIERPVWDSIVGDVRGAITDSVIEQAVRQIPPEHFALSGPFLIAALTKRRDRLPQIAERFYRMLAEQAELYATDEDEVAEIRGIDDHTVEVSLYRADEPARPYLTRRFIRDETKEVRLFLGGGRDSAVVSGVRPRGMTVRVIGGAGRDALDGRKGRWARMYDAGENTSVTNGIHLDHRRYAPPPKRSDTEIPPRDWGSRWQPGAFAAAGPDVGVFLGLAQTLSVYGFRKLPFASRHRFRAGIATGPWTGRIDYLGQFRRRYSKTSVQVLARASGIEVLRFHGFGNDFPAPGPNEFYRVTSNQYSLDLALAAPLGRLGEITFGPTARFVATDDRADRFLATLGPYGDGDFGEVGGTFSLQIQNRPQPDSGAIFSTLILGGSGYPSGWDVRESYAELHGDLTTSIQFGAPLLPMLLLRVGGKKLWGRYPYFDAAFIGGNTTVRLGRVNRYAGDASVYGSAELRLALTRIFLAAPGHFGILGLSDIGRVYLAGEQSRKWHGAIGGGIWVSVLNRFNTMSLVVVKSEERTAMNLQAAFGF